VGSTRKVVLEKPQALPEPAFSCKILSMKPAPPTAVLLLLLQPMPLAALLLECLTQPQPCLSASKCYNYP
jgi:hypothetical protein